VQSRIGRARDTLRKLLEHNVDNAASFDGSIAGSRAALPAPHPSEHPNTSSSYQTSSKGSELTGDNRFFWFGPTRAARGLEHAAHQ
jgi:hypothetical protein